MCIVMFIFADYIMYNGRNVFRRINRWQEVI